MNNEYRFTFFSMEMGYSIQIFKSNVHLIFSTDGAFLMCKYFGTLFIGIVKYGNNYIYPSTFNMWGRKDIESWIWFFTKLRDFIGLVP